MKKKLFGLLELLLSPFYQLHRTFFVKLGPVPGLRKSEIMVRISSLKSYSIPEKDKLISSLRSDDNSVTYEERHRLICFTKGFGIKRYRTRRFPSGLNNRKPGEEMEFFLSETTSFVTFLFSFK